MLITNHYFIDTHLRLSYIECALLHFFNVLLAVYIIDLNYTLIVRAKMLLSPSLVPSVETTVRKYPR